MKFLVLAIAAVIFVTACAGGPVRTGNNGLTINEIAVDPKIAEANDVVRVFLDVENVGGTTATCVQSELFGVDSWRDGLTGQSLELPVYVAAPQRGIVFDILKQGDDWFGNFCYYDIERASQICVSGDTRDGGSLRGFVGDTFSLFSNQFCNRNELYSAQLPLHKFQNTLTPPLPERNKPGQSWTAEWLLRPPVLPEGVKNTYDVTARTSFFYTSNAVVNIEALNKDEFRRRQNIGDPTVSSTPTINNVYAAPIQIAIKRGESPIIVNQDPLLGPVEYVSYTFEFQNVGNGYPLPTSGLDLPGGVGPEAESGFVFAVATIDGPGAFFNECLGQSGTEIFVPSDIMQNLVKIRSDGRAPFGCQIGLDRTRWIDTPVGTVTITFQLWYRYYIDEKVSVDVIGPERF